MTQSELVLALSEQQRLALGLLVECLNKYSTSTEFVTTWLGSTVESGGMLVIPWNVFIQLLWKCIGVARGEVEIPPELLAIIQQQQTADFIIREWRN